MNKTTYSKITLASDRLRKIYQDIEQYKFVIPLLDEPYQLALIVMEYPNFFGKEVAEEIGGNWQTIKQIRRALES